MSERVHSRYGMSASSTGCSDSSGDNSSGSVFVVAWTKTSAACCHSGSSSTGRACSDPPWTDPPWTDQERDLRERSITGLLVLDIFERDFQLQTGEMHAPMEAMRTCLDELLTHWGLDTKAQRTLSRQVAPVKQSEWSRRVVANYPIDMLRAGRSADIHIRLMVGADGTPTACMPYDSTPGNDSFERSACAWSMQFARFEPALDANGTPVASYYTTTIFYRVSR